MKWEKLYMVSKVFVNKTQNSFMLIVCSAIAAIPPEDYVLISDAALAPCLGSMS